MVAPSTGAHDVVITLAAAAPETIHSGAMAFAGVKDPKAEADLLAFLRTLNDNPPPLPEAAPAAQTNAAAPAEGQPANGQAPAAGETAAQPAPANGQAAPAEGQAPAQAQPSK